MVNNNKQDCFNKQQTELQVMQLLNLSAERYYFFQIGYGRAFLQNYISRYPQLVDEILEKEIYWTWWGKHYQLRDEAFLNTRDIHSINKQILKAMYCTIHNPYTLVEELVIDSIIFEGLSITPKPAI